MRDDPTIDFETEDFHFVIVNDHGEEIELIKNGKNEKVTKENKV